MGNSFNVGLDVAGNANGADSSVSVGVWVKGSLELPGLVLSVDNMRISYNLSMVSENGRLGLRLAGPDLGGPDGARAELTLPGFTGGGYLKKVQGSWQGAFTAKMGPVAVNGFAILNPATQSLLLLLSADLPVPIQLSFGFTLAGVGGMVGINRRADSDGLFAALQAGTLAEFMFPRNAVSDAPRILPALAASFPEKDGGFIVGPMLKLGWGTPTLASAALGVFVSDEGVVLLGRFAIVLPFEDAPLIKLQAMMLGTINADGLTIGASLTGSSIVGLPITGDIMLRTRGGSDPLFAFSAGGFHPAFTPPEGMGGLKRIGTEVSPGGFLRARLGAYLAVTTNTVQFGAAAELEAKVAGFGISGGFAFDALIMFDPFGFMADFSAHVSVECADFSIGSIRLSGHFSGPTPWRIRGHASVSILWFDVDVDVPEITWGDSNAPELPAGRIPAEVLANALKDPVNWEQAQGELPAVVQLSPAAAAGTAALHPLANVSFTQNSVPLHLELQRMDGRPLPQPVTLSLLSPANPALSNTSAKFPPSQFRSMDAQAKLAAGGYVSADAGVVLANKPDAGTVAAVRNPAVPETKIMSTQSPVRHAILTRNMYSLAEMHRLQVPEIPRLVTTARDPGAVVLARASTLSDAGVLGADAMAGINAGVAQSLLAGQGAARLDAGILNDVLVAKTWEMA
ncbi:hypothetical protein JOF48_003528 [Arthrobacter stackebrandtii]|uniref:DUF6603 domain-containing protein n=1 Tax=Arthrobacter stackebrandtii TaxID=272161 RepID=A0ABS4Z110_9MICC|nr:DUF6603 domain-containing protein [Arthrobacter stackebrandtii]MBP2414729.1 hypothetical protein [Arthrobacter stackebrandtii]PYH01813.1 hypothetical protein CVV67_05015 [Arthrobacter stackebrandtii]